MGRIVVPPIDKPDDPPVLYMTINRAEGLSLDGIETTIQLYRISYRMAPLPQEENESESMIEDKISDFLHCEVRATGKIYPV